nr:MAG TPA: hypothetical protein [Caudoviricetes sp.]
MHVFHCLSFLLFVDVCRCLYIKAVRTFFQGVI